MVLLYKAATNDGKIVHGLIEAKNETEAALYLRKKNLVPISITEHKDNPLNTYLANGGKFNASDLAFFTRQIASMLTAGLTLIQALNVLSNQVKKKAVSEVINQITADIEGGSTFSNAAASHSRIFSKVYISLIRAGESSGLLDNVMTRLAENLEKEEKLRSKIKGALLYPVIVVVMMILVVFVMMLFVIPQLKTLYDSLAIDLPFSTQILVTMSNITVQFWPILIGSMVGGFILFRRWHHTVHGRKIIDGILIKLPLFGKIIQFRILTEVSRTLGILVGSGDPVVSSLNQVRDVSGNAIYENALGLIAKQVEKGVSMGDAFAASSLFPPLLIQMIRVGEQTGKLDENLTRASEYFEREVEESVRTLTTAMEPIIMAVLGIGVAFLLVSVITPIYKLTNSL